MDKVENREYPTTFEDRDGTPFNIRLEVKHVMEFCRRENFILQQFMPAMLNSAQLIDLAYVGIQHTTKFQAHPFSKEEFYGCIFGPCLSEVEKAAENAVVNFTLATGDPQLVKLLRIDQEMKLAGKTLDERTDAVEQAALGHGNTSTESADTSESTPQPAATP